jgi:hypothetical protein
MAMKRRTAGSGYASTEEDSRRKKTTANSFAYHLTLKDLLGIDTHAQNDKALVLSGFLMATFLSGHNDPSRANTRRRLLRRR